MAKSLTEVAKQILTEGGIPSVSPMDAGHPDRDAKSSNPNLASLKPKSKGGDAAPIVTPGSTPPKGDAEDLGGATPTSPYKDNLGQKASGKVGKDTSKSSQSSAPVKAEAGSHLEEDVEISEELEAFINEMIEKGASEDEIAEAIAENFEIVEESEEEEESGKKHKKEEEEEEESGKKKLHEKKKHEEEEESEEEEEESGKKHKKAMKEHVDALLAGENLSEEFRSKAETIFESAVNTRVNEELTALEQAYATSLEEEVAKIRTELTEQVDDYLNYVVEKWVEDNEVAIEAGLRTELTEDFIAGLKNLFTEHYMDIPDEKVSVVEELGKKVEEFEAKLNEEIDRNVGLSKQINEAKQFEVLTTACEGLTTTQTEKLKALADNISFTSADEYASKIATIKESYFPSTTVSNDRVLDTNEVDTSKGMITEETTGRMSAYVKALGTKLPK